MGLTLLGQRTDRTQTSFTLELLSERGETLYTQQVDISPDCPTSQWQIGDRLRRDLLLRLPADLPDGKRRGAHNRTMPLQFVHNSFTFSSCILLLQNFLILLYMRRLPKQDRPTQFLSLFYALLVAHALVVIIANGVLLYGGAFDVLQDTLLVGSGLVLLAFGFYFPHYNEPRLASFSLGTALIVWLGLLGYALWYAWSWSYEPWAGWEMATENTAVLSFVIPLGQIMLIILYLGRALRFTPPRPPHTSYLRSRWYSWVWPPTNEVRTLRDFALVLLISSVPVWVNLYLPSVAGAFVDTAVGLLASFALAIVYVNDTNPNHSVVTKLVSISFLTMLLIFGLLGLRSIQQIERFFIADQTRLVQFLQSPPLAEPTNANIRLPADVVYMRQWELSEPPRATLVHPPDGDIPPTVVTLPGLNEQMWQMGDGLNYREVLPHGREARKERLVNTYLFNTEQPNQLFEISINNAPLHQALNSEIRALLVWLWLSALFMLFFFPLLFRRSVVRPLLELLGAVQTVNEGRLDVTVPVLYQDEIGELTQSFNQMAHSLHTSNQALYRINAELEERIAARTAALAEAKEVAETANRSKSIFLATMSHELRTPLNSILGFTQILQHRLPEQRQELDIIGNSGEHLLDLINEVLDIAKAEANKIDLNPHYLLLEPFLNTVVHSMRVQAEAKGIGLQYDQSGQLPTAVYADEIRLRQILMNLLSNAIKFTPSGQVTLHVAAQKVVPANPLPSTQTRYALTVQVIDTGVGIPANKLEGIFEPFQQAQTAHAAQGTGLGLTITRRLVTMMGGALQVESTVGQGSTFWFEIFLPEASPDMDTLPTDILNVTDDFGEGRLILLVDDQAANRMMLNQMLTSVGFQVLEAANSAEGYALALAHVPAAIITDLVMPQGGGLAFIEQIRHTAVLAEVVIITASASAFAQDRQQSLALGSDAFISKPIHMIELFTLLQRHLNLAWHFDSPTAVAPEDDLSTAVEHPTPAQISDLLTAVRVGDIMRLQELCHHLHQDPQLTRFAQKLEQLLRNYQMQEIEKWLTNLPLNTPPHHRGDDDLPHHATIAPSS